MQSLIPRLHVLTDPQSNPFETALAALAAGAKLLQIRDKTSSDREVFQLTQRVVSCATATGALVIVDDRLDVALAAGAAGVHLGATDLPLDAVRRVSELVSQGFWLGATVRTPEQAQAAERAGANYLGVGPLRATRTKPELSTELGLAGVQAITAVTSLPVIAIGGVLASDVPGLLAVGAHGVAVVSAISQAADPVQATTEFLSALALPDAL